MKNAGTSRCVMDFGFQFFCLNLLFFHLNLYSVNIDYNMNLYSVKLVFLLSWDILKSMGETDMKTVRTEREGFHGYRSCF